LSFVAKPTLPVIATLGMRGSSRKSAISFNQPEDVEIAGLGMVGAGGIELADIVGMLKTLVPL
jgi:hypothetical protein